MSNLCCPEIGWLFLHIVFRSLSIDLFCSFVIAYPTFHRRGAASARRVTQGVFNSFRMHNVRVTLRNFASFASLRWKSPCVHCRNVGLFQDNAYCLLIAYCILPFAYCLLPINLSFSILTTFAFPLVVWFLQKQVTKHKPILAPSQHVLSAWTRAKAFVHALKFKHLPIFW